MTRWSVARQTGRRGVGLGNEVLALAKAQIGARVFEGVLVEQPWWLNPRGYGAVMGNSVSLPLKARLRGIRYPSVVLDRGLVPNIWDYEQSMNVLAATLPSDCQVIHASGMAGGYLGILSARDFLKGRLGISDPEQSSPALRIGVHMRAGDFLAGPVEPGSFNVRLSPRWVSTAVSQIATAWAGPVELTVVTDAERGDEGLRAFERGLQTGLEPNYPAGDALQDLRSLAACDVIVPSVSSFSMLAIFLSDAKYVWPREGLTESNGWLSLWGHEPDVAAGPTARAIACVEAETVHSAPRGLPIDQDGTTDVSGWLQPLLRPDGLRWPLETDLIFYGVARSGQR